MGRTLINKMRLCSLIDRLQRIVQSLQQPRVLQFKARNLLLLTDQRLIECAEIIFLKCQFGLQLSQLLLQPAQRLL